MDDPKPCYVIDTSVWFNLRVILTLPGMWDHLNSLMTDGRIVIPREVVDEFGQTGDEVHRWVRDHPGSHRSTENVWDIAIEVANESPDLVTLTKKRVDADAFVVATAIAEKAQRATGMFPCEVVVVCGEKTKLPGRVMIPDACAKRDIRCVNITEWFEMEGLHVTGPPRPPS